MWILKTQRYCDDDQLVYTGTDISIQVLFETFKTIWPEATFSLESMLTGAMIVPHSGNEYPYWFNRDGLENQYHHLTFVSREDQKRMDFRSQVRTEGMSPGHSSKPEAPPEEDNEIL